MQKRKHPHSVYAFAFPILTLFIFGAAGLHAASIPLSIDALVADVLKRNAERAIYEAEIAAARGERQQARRWSNPEFSLEAGHKRVGNAAGAPSDEGLVWAASIAQPIEFPGRIALRSAIADRNVELAELGLEQFERHLESRVRTLGQALYLSRTHLDAVDQVVFVLRELLEAVLQRETGGVSPLLERHILEAHLLGFESRRLEARELYQQSLIELNQLRNLPAERNVRIQEPTLALPVLPPLRNLVVRAWDHAFEAQVRRVELEQQGYRTQLARKDRVSAITLEPYISQDNVGERETIIGLGLSFPLPLWDRNTGNISAEVSRQRQAEASLLVVQRELERRVVERALAYQSARELLHSLPADFIERMEEAAGLAERHFRLGAISVGTFLEMQTAYLDSLDAYLSTRRKALDSLLELELITGMLTQEEMP